MIFNSSGKFALFATLVFTCALALVVGVVALAQETGTLMGVVFDPEVADQRAALAADAGQDTYQIHVDADRLVLSHKTTAPVKEPRRTATHTPSIVRDFILTM